jgi:hypothetical protein
MRHATFQMEKQTLATGSALVASHAVQKAKPVCRTGIALQPTSVSSIVGFAPIKPGLSQTAQELVMKVDIPRFLCMIYETPR